MIAAEFTRWDVFGRTEVRRTERQLLAEFRALVGKLLAQFRGRSMQA